MKQAVILAAGRGTRLGEVGQDSPKCLLNVGGRSLLDIQLGILFQAGIEEVCIVAGHHIEYVRQQVADYPGVTVLHNPIYDTTNSLYSLSLAKDWVRGSFVCVNGDVVAHPDIFNRVLAVEGCALAYDSGSGEDAEQMKVNHSDGYLRSISKQMEADIVCGENVGLLQFDQIGAARLFAFAEEVLEVEGPMLWAPAVLNQLARRTSIRCVDIRGLPWTEVDFPEDLKKAREVIWPSICALGKQFSGLPAQGDLNLRASAM